MTPGDWRVFQAADPADAGFDGRLVHDQRRVVVADCRNDALGEAEQRENAKAIAYLPQIISVLRQCEGYFGDKPAKGDREAARIYARVAVCLNVIDGR